MTSRTSLNRVQSPLIPSAANDLVRKADIEAYVRKTATESVTSSTTLQNDDHLLLALLANTKYAFEGFFIYDGTIASDIQIAFTVPASSTVNYSAFAPATGVSPTSYSAYGISTSGGALGLACNGASNLMGMQPKGYVATSGTAGNLQLQWAQFSSGATASRIFANSWLKATVIQ